MTQRDVARAMGMKSEDFIGMVEAGIRRLDVERLPDLAKVLRLPLPLLTQMHFTEVYGGKPETQWLVDLLYGIDQDIARKITILDGEARQTVKLMIDLLVSKQNPNDAS